MAKRNRDCCAVVIGGRHELSEVLANIGRPCPTAAFFPCEILVGICDVDGSNCIAIYSARCRTCLHSAGDIVGYRHLSIFSTGGVLGFQVHGLDERALPTEIVAAYYVHGRQRYEAKSLGLRR